MDINDVLRGIPPYPSDWATLSNWKTLSSNFFSFKKLWRIPWKIERNHKRNTASLSFHAALMNTFLDGWEYWCSLLNTVPKRRPNLQCKSVNEIKNITQPFITCPTFLGCVIYFCSSTCKCNCPRAASPTFLWMSCRNVESFDSTSSRPCFNTLLPNEHKHVIIITFSTVNETLEKFGLRFRFHHNFLKDFPTWQSTVKTMAKATHGNIWQLHTDAFRKVDGQKFRNHFVMFWEMLILKRWFFKCKNISEIQCHEKT